ncbi:MAG: hypothetical protein GF353_21545 [Candidatus Lokiarchaeota archaeon]|nr:hypothetical protein [Candidatus Lokiarchaeota archaeon]
MSISFHNKPIPEPYTIYVRNFDFERYLEYAHEDINCELIHGVLIIHSPVSLENEIIFKFMLTLLDLYVHKKKLGLVVGSRFTMNLSSKWAPESDIMFIASDSESTLKETYLDGPATVVIEILSPSTQKDDLNKKLPKYLKSGVKEVWIVDPMKKNFTTHWSKDQSRIYKESEWTKSKIIPEFRLKVNWLWKAKSISVLEKLKELKGEEKKLLSLLSLIIFLIIRNILNSLIISKNKTSHFCIFWDYYDKLDI